MKTQIDYFSILEFNRIKSKLIEYAITEYAHRKIDGLSPFLNESELTRALNETTNAREIIDYASSPTIPKVDEIKSLMSVADKKGILYPDQLERITLFISSCKRLKAYLKKAEYTNTALAFSGINIDTLDDIFTEINRCIRGDDIVSDASKELSAIRRNIAKCENMIKTKLETLLKSKKKYCTENFIANKNGHFTLPVKKDFKNEISGTVITTSSTGTTVFIEPSAVIKLTDELASHKIDEDVEKERILYIITGLIIDNVKAINLNIEIIETLDFAFAKGKLSNELKCVRPKINTSSYMKIVKGRHPLLNQDMCIPIDFEIGNGITGIVITGPNTGGKTVTLKLVGLFTLMAQSGLHLPCIEADISMRSNILCDIGDGQNISQNLSTFSSHISNIIDILSQTGKESLVLLDEVGSGTDPAEGMGIAVSILEELENRKCLFVATTHYVEVKQYAEKKDGLINARMTFDKETLRPQYQLIIGEAGQSCALYIAKKLGFPQHLLEFAKMQINSQDNTKENNIYIPEKPISTNTPPLKTSHIEKTQIKKQTSQHALSFNKGDSVTVYPSKEIGIVYSPSDEMGNLVVQIKGKKKTINHKRLKLKVSASTLYPPDYDFSIIFDSVENRKASKKMTKHHDPDLVIKYDNNN